MLFHICYKKSAIFLAIRVKIRWWVIEKYLPVLFVFSFSSSNICIPPYFVSLCAEMRLRTWNWARITCLPIKITDGTEVTLDFSRLAGSSLYTNGWSLNKEPDSIMCNPWFVQAKSNNTPPARTVQWGIFHILTPSLRDLGKQQKTRLLSAPHSYLFDIVWFRNRS